MIHVTGCWQHARATWSGHAARTYFTTNLPVHGVDQDVLDLIARCAILTGLETRNMVTHMKTTIEIADSLLLRAKARARERRVTLRSLIEESLASALDQPSDAREVQPVTFRGNGLSREFQDASWDRIRDEIYR